jgi:hypothetical protein
MTAGTDKRDKVDAILDGGGTVAPWERDGDTTDVPDVALPQGESGILPDSPNGETALVTAEQGQAGMMVFSEDLDFEMGEMRIPYLKLLGLTSPEVSNRQGQVGQWFLEGHGAVDAVEIAILGVSRFRELREDMSVPNARTLCRSNDGVIGVGAPGGICKTCPMAQWGEKNASTGKGTPPPCNNGFMYQVYSLTHGQPALLALRKSGIDAAKTINTGLQLRKARNFVTIISHVDKPNPVNPKGTYPAPHATNRPITPEEKMQADEAAAMLGMSV